MISTVPGTITKQGPIATLEGDFDFSGEDRFMFNGDQFVHFIAQIPRAVEASANTISLMSGDQVFFKNSYTSYLNSNGDYRLVDGNPVSDGNDTGRPTAGYDHVIVGYNTTVTTDTVKFWAEEYIPVGLIRIDYSYDGEHFFEVETNEGNVSFIFDDSIKIYETEDVPSGQYIYTVDLGKQYTAKYWRIRSFLFTHNMAKVTSVDGKDVLMATTSGLPSSSTVYGTSKFFYNSNTVDSSIITQETEYGIVEVVGDGTYDVSGVLFDTDTEVGTVYAGACSITVEEQTYSYTTAFLCDKGCDHFLCDLGPINQPWCFTEYLIQHVDSSNTLYHVETTEDFNISTTSPTNIDLTVDGYLPAYLPGQTGPNGGIVKISVQYSMDYATKTAVNYNSINGSTLEAMEIPASVGTDLEAGQNFYYRYDMKLTQVKIPERLGPQLRYWESDGSEAVTNTVSLDNIYDVSYDVSDGVYYAVRFNETGGVGNPSISEDFSSGTIGSFNLDKWDLAGNGFYRDPIAKSLLLNNTVSGVYVSGDLVSKSYFTGDFDITLPVAVDTLSGTGYYGFTLRDKDKGNQLGGIYTVGEWGTVAGDRAVSAVVVDSLVNATDSIVSVGNFRISPYDLYEGEISHTFDYLTGSGWYYTRENISSPGADDIDYRFSSPGPYVVEDGFSAVFEDNSDEAISNGSSISFITERATVSGINADDITMYASYTDSSESMQFSYDDTVVSSAILDRTIETLGSNFKANITGASNNFITVSSTSFVVNGDLGLTVPCLEVHTIDENGELTSVSGVSTTAGTVMQTFDVIATPGLRYEDLFGQISIITTNQTETLGGSIFVAVGSDLYKYNKTTLPLTSRETGTNAAVLASGTLPDEHVRGLNYDGYVVGGISFLLNDEERDGVYLRTVSDSTLLVTGNEAQLDLVSNNVPFARDALDSGVLYTVIDNDVSLYNADEDSVAFCNIVSSDPILPASSNHSAIITARVVNMFGTPLQGKNVSFSITSGDGSLSPTYGCSTSSGTVSTVYTASSSVGTSIITATASNDSC